MNKNQLAVLVGLLIMELVTAMDQTGVTVLLPTLRNIFGISSSFEAWAMVTYMVPFFLLLIPFGFLADRYHCAEKMIVWSIFLFGVSAVLCGLVSDEYLFGLFRATKGIGAAGMYACEFVIIMKYWTETRRVVEIVMSGIALGVLLGPIIGGLFASPALWRYFFFLSALLAFAAFLLYRFISRLNPIVRSADQVAVLEKSFGQKLKLLLGLIAWGLFLNLIISAGNQAVLLLTTLEVQEHQGRSALMNTAILAVVAISMAAANLFGLGSRLFKKTEHAVVAAGFLTALCLVMLARFTTWTDPAAFALYVLLGVGVGIFYATIELMALDPLPSSLLAQGNGMMMTAMECGYTLSSFIIPLSFVALGTAATTYGIASFLFLCLAVFWLFGRKN